MSSEETQCVNPLIKIAIAVKNTEKTKWEKCGNLIDVLTNVVTLMYWRKVIIVELW